MQLRLHRHPLLQQRQHVVCLLSQTALESSIELLPFDVINEQDLQNRTEDIIASGQVSKDSPLLVDKRDGGRDGVT